MHSANSRELERARQEESSNVTAQSTMRERRNTSPFLLVSIALYVMATTVLMLFKETKLSAVSISMPTPLNDLLRYGGSSDMSSSTMKNNKDYVFIGVKTSEVGVHGERLPQIQKTWLKDAVKTGIIDTKFFTHVQVNQTTHEDNSLLMVTTSCARRNLECKTSKVFAYYLENSTAPWFCSFDDDNYVLVENLIKLLKSYENGPTKNIYLGRNPGVGKFFRRVNATLRFGTGGAGYCLNRNLVERGKEHFTSLTSTHLPDDVSVGYVAQEKLGVNITISPLLHSHYERGLRKRMPQEDIAKQITFGRDNKGEYGKPPVDHMPNIPMLFPYDEDPLSFRALWCFLHESERHSPECTPSNTTVEE